MYFFTSLRSEKEQRTAFGSQAIVWPPQIWVISIMGLAVIISAYKTLAVMQCILKCML